VLINSYFPEEVRWALKKIKLISDDSPVETLINKTLVMRFDLLSLSHESSAYQIDMAIDTYIDKLGNLCERKEKYILESIATTSRIVSIEYDSFIQEHRANKFRADRDSIDQFSIKLFLDLDYIASFRLRFLTVMSEGLCLAYNEIDQDDDGFDDADFTKKILLMPILEYQIL